MSDMIETQSTWISKVRDYEIDFQGILNNACYFQYMDQARALYFFEIGLDVVKLYQEGIKIVLIESRTKFVSSLKYNEEFKIYSELKRISRFKLLFTQKILEVKSERICVFSENTCCILSKYNKPYFPELLSSLKINCS